MQAWNERLKALREDADIQQNDLAKILNIHPKTLFRYEAGISEPTVTVLIKLADYFHVSLDYLIGRSDTSIKTIYDITKTLEGLKNQIDDVIISIEHNNE